MRAGIGWAHWLGHFDNDVTIKSYLKSASGVY